MDENRNFHSQQDCPGCVDDEANIVNKCDARRQVVSGNEMFFLSKEWDGSISVLTAVYEDLLRGEQVDGLTAVYERLLIVGQADVQQAVHGCLHVHAHDRGQDVRGFAQW